MDDKIKEVMGLVDLYAEECGDFARGLPSDIVSARALIETKLRELLESAAKDKTDAECFRWWVHEAAVNPGLVATAIAKCITEDEYRAVICGAMEAKNAAINAAKAKA